MWSEAADIVGAELSSHEKLLWSGRPRLGLILRGVDAFLIPFSLLWGGFAIFWETSVLAAGAPVFFALWGIPFVLLGLYLIFGRFLVDARQRARTYYGVTSERVIIISGVFGRRVKSLNLDTLTDLSLTERASGAGVITFGSVPPWYWWHASGSWPGMAQHAVPTFELAEEARHIYELIRSAQRNAKQRTSSPRADQPAG